MVEMLVGFVRANTEFYAQGGFSFHSSDARGATQTVEPISADNPYPNTPVSPIPALIPTKGAEIGVRTVAVQHLQSTFSPWYLHSASELQQVETPEARLLHHSRATATASNGRTTTTRRWGIGLSILTLRTSKPSRRNRPRRCCTSPGGKRVPEAVELLIASGITLNDYKGFSSTLRLRYFGPRNLTSDGIYRSQVTALLNGGVNYQIGEKWRLSAEFLNLLNRRDNDIDYAYSTRDTPTGASAFTDVFHPVEPFQVRFSLGRTF